MGAAPLPPADAWRGFHCLAPPMRLWHAMPQLVEWLATRGINVLVLQVDYRLAFAGRPDLRDEDPLSPADLGSLAQVCADHGMALIPQFKCLSHQDIRGRPAPLLRGHPEFEEPRGGGDMVPAQAASWREWCPSHPGLHEVVLPLIDEIIDACNAPAIHVGMDEAMHLGSPECPRCAGRSRAELLAGEVTRLHAHIVGKRRLQMLMWADRLIDGTTMDHGVLESSHNGTAPAIDMIPRDVILCDWHYERRDAYPSVAHFISKGFHVLPAVWRDGDQAAAFLAAAQAADTDGRVLGVLFTTWSRDGVLSLLPGVDDAHQDKALMGDVAGVIEALDGQ